VSVTTVLLADDHPVVRQGLRALLEAEPDIDVIGEAADGLQAVRAVERLKPHVLVADVQMPGLTGLEVAREITQSRLDTRVVILSMHDRPAYVSQALRYGASGYVLKDATHSELVRAVREVAKGRQYLSGSLPESAAGENARQIQETAAADRHELLTTRERAVLQLTAEGHTAAEIGAKLFISPRTVESHRMNLAQKLGLRTLSDVIRYAIRRGIVSLDA
jgi:DNA-binding NarL/FixJ family response regulator